MRLGLDLTRVALSVAETPSDAVKEAEIIYTVTTSREPILNGESTIGHHPGRGARARAHGQAGICVRRHLQTPCGKS